MARIGDRSFTLKVGDRAAVPRRSLHKLSSDAGAEILEVAYGEFDEGDIVRIKDDYGRV